MTMIFFFLTNIDTFNFFHTFLSTKKKKKIQYLYGLDEVNQQKTNVENISQTKLCK